MQLGAALVEGRFLTRLNRFAALVDIEGEEAMVHVANSGRMHELFVPGVRVLLKPQPAEHRKTKFDLALVDLGFSMCSADARLPNALVSEALEFKRLPQFVEYPHVRREVTFGESRLDLMLEGPEGKYYVETKSVTLVVKGTGMVYAAPGFERQWAVIDGASNFYVDVFGAQAGQHARSAIGMFELPRHYCMEIEAIFEIEP